MGAMLALVFAVFLASASADWLSGVAISNLASIGEVAFLTQSGTGLILMKGLQSQVYLDCIAEQNPVCTFPPVPTQNFVLGAEYAAIPSKPFTIKIGGKYVQKSGTVLSIKATASPTKWTIDSYGRICSGGWCLDVPSINLKTKVGLTAFSASSNTQQWVVLPSTNPPPIATLSPPSTFYGQIMLDDPATPGLCLQAAAKFPNGTVIYNVTTAPGGGLQANGIFSGSLLPGLGLQPCDASKPDQMVQSQPGVYYGYGADGGDIQGGDYPTGNFNLYFAATNTCLTASIPQAAAGTAQGLYPGRFGVVMDLKDCVNLASPENSDVAYGMFNLNSRGQIQSALYINGTLIGNTPAAPVPATLPLCLSLGGVAASINKNVIDKMVLSDCSHYRYSNRWAFIPHDPPTTKQASSGL